MLPSWPFRHVYRALKVRDLRTLESSMKGYGVVWVAVDFAIISFHPAKRRQMLGKGNCDEIASVLANPERRRM